MKLKKLLSALVFGLLVTLTPGEAAACTSAIIRADMNPYGRPLLWKHRDTQTTDNKVEYVEGRDGEHSYVALFNAGDRGLKQAWMGMNDVGFAIMNTASYNLKDDDIGKRHMDKEGYVMTRALKTCKSVDDFGKLLESLPFPIGVEANFGVIDAAGNGAFFETNNHLYHKYDIKNAENGVLVRTNYSHKGREGEGYGYVREANAEHLLAPYIEQKAVTPEVLTEVLSRSFYRDTEKEDFSTADFPVVDEDFIPRYKSTATIVIEGCRPVKDLSAVKPGALANQYIMWTGMGYPPCSEIIPVWCRPGGVDSQLVGRGANGHSAMGDKVKKRRAEVFVTRKGDKRHYIDMKKLFNDKGTGYVQTLTRQNRETYERVRSKRDGLR